MNNKNMTKKDQAILHKLYAIGSEANIYNTLYLMVNYNGKFFNLDEQQKQEGMKFCERKLKEIYATAYDILENGYGSIANVPECLQNMLPPISDPRNELAQSKDNSFYGSLNHIIEELIMNQKFYSYIRKITLKRGFGFDIDFDKFFKNKNNEKQDELYALLKNNFSNLENGEKILADENDPNRAFNSLSNLTKTTFLSHVTDEQLIQNQLLEDLLLDSINDTFQFISHIQDLQEKNEKYKNIKNQISYTSAQKRCKRMIEEEKQFIFYNANFLRAISSDYKNNSEKKPDPESDFNYFKNLMVKEDCSKQTPLNQKSTKPSQMGDE